MPQMVKSKPVQKAAPSAMGAGIGFCIAVQP